MVEFDHSLDVFLGGTRIQDYVNLKNGDFAGDCQDAKSDRVLEAPQKVRRLRHGSGWTSTKTWPIGQKENMSNNYGNDFLGEGVWPPKPATSKEKMIENLGAKSLKELVEDPRKLHVVVSCS